MSDIIDDSTDRSTSRIRRFSMLAAGMVALLLGAASAAWACSPQAYIYLSPVQGDAEAPVTVTGRDFLPTTVELRWETADGKLLGEATGPAFEQQVTIPDVEPGPYLIVASVYNADGSVAGRARARYQVVGDDSGGEASQPARSTADQPASEDGAANDEPADGEQEASTEEQAQQTNGEPTDGEQPAAPPETDGRAPSAEPAAVTTDEGQVVFGGSTGLAAERRTGGSSLRNSAHAGVLAGLTRGSTALQADADAATVTRDGPREDPWAAVAQQDDGVAAGGLGSAEVERFRGVGTYLAVGSGLLGMGLVVLFAALTIATVRRRRAPSMASEQHGTSEHGS